MALLATGTEALAESPVLGLEVSRNLDWTLTACSVWCLDVQRETSLASSLW